MSRVGLHVVSSCLGAPGPVLSPPFPVRLADLTNPISPYEIRCNVIPFESIRRRRMRGNSHHLLTGRNLEESSAGNTVMRFRSTKSIHHLLWIIEQATWGGMTPCIQTYSIVETMRASGSLCNACTARCFCDVRQVRSTLSL